MTDTEPIRCAWAMTPAMAHYHDTEWGVPSRDDRHLFEMLVLEGAQAGLSWSTILNKRDGYRALFADFDIDTVARFTDADVERIVGDARIVRNRAKIQSAVLNARAVQRIQAEHGSFAAFVWSFVDGETIDTPRDASNPTPASTPESDAMSRALKQYGCKFVGTTICYAFMQATGMVNDHAADCVSRAKARTKRKAAAGAGH
ncbi:MULTISPECIES: DNA-3-methyladenine glycosylase I [unclassified Caballeronia]|uniref:DNA-3-methyladenine glycosylase I n=1 Tax=unclassified Caballeronia TaxID=2646786 RepID=UPI002862A33E|nr:MULTISPECIES: DNA-3-methyladenine glycosylase I [unclassified Caballeronia]MDR5736911.1 DNA-3-methyladenine glycosylase I [Caballeronia sp. LZ016]MDR5810557.1 DNA-3-methyladenine glycosylase I [Caballeronia sp. LZ019]